MDDINELFKETNVLAKTFRKSGRVKISLPPRQTKEKKKMDNPSWHRYGPEDRPPPFPINDMSQKETKKSQESVTLAFCALCGCDRPMKWKERKKRGKDVKSWFVCAVCGCDCLEIKNGMNK
jgi:hypothetical protein